MSIAAVRSALEQHLASISPAIQTAYENAEFTPTAGAPYQAVYLLPATPDNAEIGPGYTEQGLLQVSLFYPIGAGPAAAAARAEAIRAAFPFAASFTANGVVVNITATPEIGVGRTDDDRFMVPVRVRWRAYIGG